MPELPSIYTGIVLALILLALTLFALERMRLESAALLILICLLLVFAAPVDHGTPVSPGALFRAFGNEALVAVSALMVLGKGIEVTRALRPMVGLVSRYWSAHPGLMMLLLLIVAGILSAFLNNTPIVVVLLPPLAMIARQNNLSPSKLLMPFGLVTIIGGMATTIGTSTNLLVVGLAADVAEVRFAMFDFTSYVAIAGAAGILYLWLLAPRITPDRGVPETARQAREFIGTMTIDENSRLVERTVEEFLELCSHEIDIDYIEHAGRIYRAPLPTVTLHANDRVHVRGTRDALKDAEHMLQADLKDVDHEPIDVPASVPRMMELLVTAASDLHGRTLRETGLRDDYGIAVVALHRTSVDRHRTRRNLADMRLMNGDILLCEGTAAQFERIAAETALLPLYESRELPFTNKSRLALLISVAVVAVAALGVYPISVAAVTGVGLMLAGGCIGWRHIAEALSAKVIMVIVVSLALGNALMATEGDEYLAALFNLATSGAAPAAIIPILMLLAAALTNIVTNNAAAVIAVPIAVQIAAQTGIPAEAVILTVLFGANLSFITPIGYQTNLLVFSAGGYRFSDFIRVGLPLTLLMSGILSWLIIERYSL